MKRLTVCLLAICLLLCGCGNWMDGSYYHVTPHPINGNEKNDIATVETYEDILAALGSLAQTGTDHAILYMQDERLEAQVEQAVEDTLKNNPFAAYAVEAIQWETGTYSGQNAVAVDLTFRHDRTELQKIRQAEDMESMTQQIYRALNDCISGVVLYVQNFIELDLAQLVSDYADENPSNVMEKPQVVINIYPRTGTERVVELKFTYQNSRDALSNMQNQVRPVFAAAELYVSGDASDTEKLTQLYSFLMERYEYRIETSITPSYSLLRHGVGDPKAFAVVYAAMCRQAGMDCRVVNGTRQGESWYWNMVKDGDFYYHVDLLRCSAEGNYVRLSDEQMDGYVWDYSAYPECVAAEETVPEKPAENP